MKTNEATTAIDNDDNLERINDEIQFVTSAYTPDEAWVETPSPPPTSSPLSSTPSSQHDHHHPPLIIHRRLTLKIKNDITLSLTIPKGYPSQKTILVDGTTTTTKNKDVMMTILPRLLRICRDEAAEQKGNEAVFAVLTRADSWIDEWRESSEMTTTTIAIDDNGIDGDDILTRRQQRQRLVTTWGRRSIYSHHIIAASKRKSLSSLASHYDLGGYIKIGWPGLIIVEGLEENVTSFVEEIRSWRWQYLTVRGEQRVEVDDGGCDEMRVFEKGFRELGEDGGMKELGRICREVGLEQLFLMAINRSDDNDGGGGGDMSTAPSSSNNNNNDNQNNNNNNGTQKMYGAMIQLDHMNDIKIYTKWLHKTCLATGCHVLIRHCYHRRHRHERKRNNSTRQQSQERPFIIICFLCGDQRSNVKQFLKRWRTSKVDVDARGTPCLERMMTLLMEGEVALSSSLRRRRQQKIDDDDDDNDDMVITVTIEALKDMAFEWGGRGWEDVMEEVLGASLSRSDEVNAEV